MNVETLCAYTGYGQVYVAAIAENMVINRFWVGDRHDVSEWIRHGYLDEEMFFGRHIQMAIGDMWRDQETRERANGTWDVMMDPAL